MMKWYSKRFNIISKETVIYAGLLLIFCSLIYTSITLNQDDVDKFTVTNKKEECQVVSLEVVNMYTQSFMLFSNPTYFTIELSNGMAVDVSRKQYQNYEIGQTYEFELITTTSVQKIIQVPSAKEK